MNNKPFFIDEYTSPLGRLTMAACDNMLVGLWFVGQKYYSAGVPDNATVKPEVPIFYRTKKWLDEYFAGAQPNISDLPLAPTGSEFQQKVWYELCKIPYGETKTYGEIAGRINAMPRAVGGAIGRNPISIIIPCHRVVGAGGKLTGYAGGIHTKEQLLRHEHAIIRFK